MTQRTVDPRSGLVLDAHELSGHGGDVKEFVRDVPAPEGLGNDVIGVPAGSPISVDVRLEAVGEGVLATGTAEVQVRGECGRCLAPIAFPERIDIQELFLYPGKELDDEEASRVVNDLVDLSDVVRDSVVLDLPFQPLCRPDCAGLCAECGANLNEHPDHAHEGGQDPRWAGLSEWTNEPEN